MKKSILILFILSLIFFSLYYYVASPLLKYAEGWNTFYYDSHYISELFKSRGIFALCDSFLLQFFAHPWHGMAVMTVLSLIMLAIITLILNTLIKGGKWKKILVPVCAFAITVFLSTNLTSHLSKFSIFDTFRTSYTSANDDIKFILIDNMKREQKWDEIILVCSETPTHNLLIQNALNMSLAEKGRLGDRLFDQPCKDIRSIYVDQISSPYIAGFLSDIYFSMGHIAQSQRYAFEANEKMDNMSPRMLQRLTQTSIIYGQYKLAEKYIAYLNKTAYYKEWCAHYSQLLNDRNLFTDKEMSMKRKCLFPDNRFSGIYGLDDDLLNIARATKGTPQCRTTLQYLGSLYILAGYADQFSSLLNEFGDTDELGNKLPKYFEEYRSFLESDKDK